MGRGVPLIQSFPVSRRPAHHLRTPPFSWRCGAVASAGRRFSAGGTGGALNLRITQSPNQLLDCCPVAQSVERPTLTREAGGANPPGAANFQDHALNVSRSVPSCPCSPTMAEALHSECRGCRFESGHGYYYMPGRNQSPAQPSHAGLNFLLSNLLISFPSHGLVAQTVRAAAS